MTHRPFLSLVTAGLVASLVAACSSTETKTVQTPPVAGTYSIAFPSTAAAVATDAVQVLVFDASGDAGNTCAGLVEKRKSHQDLPTPLTQTAQVSVCSLQNGSSGQISLGFGPVAVLVVATRNATGDFLIGCNTKTVTADDTNVSVSVTFASTSTSVPPTTCAKLTDHCAGSC